MKPDIPNRDFYLVDYSAASKLLKNYSNMRISAVGISLAIYGALIAIPINEYLEYFFMPMSMSLIMVSCIRIIGTLNANVYARCIHLEWIEQQLNVVGFFSYWNNFVPNNKADAASNAYVVAANVLNYGTLLYNLLCAFRFQTKISEDVQSKLLSDVFTHIEYSPALILCVFGIIVFLLNYIYIRNHMNIETLIPRIRESLSQQRASLVKIQTK